MAIKTYRKEQSFPTVKSVCTDMHVIGNIQIIVKHGRAPIQTSKHPDVDSIWGLFGSLGNSANKANTIHRDL